jgi:DNA-directed RNA polymerase specialized sigma24 family protein
MTSDVPGPFLLFIQFTVPMMNDSVSPAGFPTTHWSRVVAAGDVAEKGAGEALAELCSAYWFPLYAYIRRRGNGPEQALDLTQEYFARLLERGTVASADPARGRFRSFLLADCRHFLAHQRERDGAAGRGGRLAVLSIDARDAEGQYQLEPAHEQTPERLFERDFALALLEGVVAVIRREYEAFGRAASFKVLKVVLEAGSSQFSQADLAALLGTTEAAAQVAVHRLRKRYREALRAAIAATVADEAEVDDEIRALFTALGP